MGDTGLINHPAMGRFTAKKTIEYLMRDVKKEQELINQIQDFINNLGVKETLNVLSSITIDSCSTKIHGQEIAIKLEVFGALQVLKAFGIMPASKLGFRTRIHKRFNKVCK